MQGTRSGQFSGRVYHGTDCQILHEDLKGTKTFYEEQEKIMEGLDQEIKDKFEDFASNMICISAKECLEVYKEAFLDGLRLGHRAFR